MLDFDAGKLVVIGVVALVVIGPKDLPRVMRQVGQTVGKLRRMAADFQSQFMDAMREAEMADVKEEMGKIAETAKLDVAFDPIRDIRNQITGAMSGETKPDGATALTAALPQGPENSIDLSALETATSPSSDAAVTEGGLVAAGIAPAAVAEPAEPGAPATLEDVKQALDETLGIAPPDGVDRHDHQPVQEGQPVKASQPVQVTQPVQATQPAQVTQPVKESTL